MLVHSAARAAWRLQTAIGLAHHAAIDEGGFAPSRESLPGDLDHLAECLLAACPVLIDDEMPWAWLYACFGLAHARAGRVAEALEVWRLAEPMLAAISGRRLEAEHPGLALIAPPVGVVSRGLAAKIERIRWARNIG